MDNVHREVKNFLEVHASIIFGLQEQEVAQKKGYSYKDADSKHARYEIIS